MNAESFEEEKKLFEPLSAITFDLHFNENENMVVVNECGTHRSKCSEIGCMNPISRLKKSWIPTCDLCFVEGGYLNHQPIESIERFPEKHRGVNKCPCRRCYHSQLIIVYDDEDDEWLFCSNCQGFKQMLRVWNKVTNTMVDALDRPILRWKSTSSNQFEPDISEESDVSRTASDDDSPSSESLKDAGVMDGSDDSDQSMEDSDAENSDIPYPEPIVYQVLSTAAVTCTTATPKETNFPPTATNLPPVISTHSPTSGKLESPSEVVLKQTSSESENQINSGNKPEESVKQSNKEDQSMKEEQATKEELPLPPPANSTPTIAIVAPASNATPAGIHKTTHIPVTAQSLAAARLKVAAEKKAIAEAVAAKLAEDERKKDEKIALERKKKEDAAALVMEKKLEHDRLVAADAARKVELKQKKAVERRRKAEEEKKAKEEQDALIQKLLDEKRAKKEAITQKKREKEEEQKTQQLVVEKKGTNDTLVAAARKKAIAKAIAATTAATAATTAAQAPTAAEAGGGTFADPDDYCCPVSLVLMQDPVVAADGITYDRSTIQGWFENCIQNLLHLQTRVLLFHIPI